MARAAPNAFGVGPGFEVVRECLSSIFPSRPIAHSLLSLPAPWSRTRESAHWVTAAYWEIGRRIVKFKQHGRDRADYGAAVVDRLAKDLSARLGRGFSRRNVFQMRAFYLAFANALLQAAVAPRLPTPRVQTASALFSGNVARKVIVQTASGKSAAPPICSTPSSIFQTASGKSSLFNFNLRDLARAFSLPCSPYVLLVSRSCSPEALEFYRTEALRGDWSVRQPDTPGPQRLTILGRALYGVQGVG